MTDLAHKLQQLIALGECPCKSHTWSHWDTVLSEAVEIIKRLPVDANGNTVVPGDRVLQGTIEWEVTMRVRDPGMGEVTPYPFHLRVLANEAVEAARKGADDDS